MASWRRLHRSWRFEFWDDARSAELMRVPRGALKPVGVGSKRVVLLRKGLGHVSRTSSRSTRGPSKSASSASYAL